MTHNVDENWNKFEWANTILWGTEQDAKIDKIRTMHRSSFRSTTDGWTEIHDKLGDKIMS